MIRGVVALGQSMSIGFKALEASTNAQADPGDEPIAKTTWALTIVAALALAVGLFFVVPVGPAWYILLATRIVGVPLVAGLSFELIKFAGRNRGKAWVQLIIWPGMQLQKLTTREPDDEQVEVAIVALEAVLAIEDPRAASAEDRIGVEVAA